jgi:hypothetical protein
LGISTGGGKDGKRAFRFPGFSRSVIGTGTGVLG